MMLYYTVPSIVKKDKKSLSSLSIALTTNQINFLYKTKNKTGILRMRQAKTIIVNFLIIIINQLESEDMFDKSS